MPSSAHWRLMLNAPSPLDQVSAAPAGSALQPPLKKIPFHRQLADLRV